MKNDSVSWILFLIKNVKYMIIKPLIDHIGRDIQSMLSIKIHKDDFYKK
jgi:hypothetical protein